MQFYALVEEWPEEGMVFFRELPGCFSSAATTTEALRKAPEVITDYFRWLKANDIVLVEEEVTPIRVVLKEQLASEGNAGPFFEADRAAPDDLEIDNALNVAATARASIIEMMSEVPSTLHDTVPAQGGWSLTQHLQHLMESEIWYVERLLEHLPEKQPAAPMSADDISMKMFENAMDNEVLLRDLTPAQRSQVFVHSNETWTAAKVLRRMTQHLREHYPWMQEIARQVSENK
ncbi:MAG: type II toxin-antitoxin system HicB family antitoxin [Ktedonobacteraceae bacterium]